MKNILLLGSLFISFSAISQNFKRIKDPALLAQEKRMVFERWGDWKPEAKYIKIFGVEIGENISKNHAMVWGKWLAPKRNRQYMKGPDIRPLRVGGEETNRMLKVQLMKQQAELIQKSVDSIRKRSQDDMAHWTHLTVDADPLYLLYYKRMLEPLRKFSSRPSNYRAWGFENDDIYQMAKSTGQLEILQEKLALLKESYKKAKTLAMPRGKRFLLFHKTLMKWRDFQTMRNQIAQTNSLLFENKKRIKTELNTEALRRSKTDKEIVQEVMQRYNHKF